jgi:hypothetical protein
MFDARYRPSPDAPWQEFTLRTDDLALALDRIQRRFHPQRTEAEWRALEQATDKRLAEVAAAREAREAWLAKREGR